MLSLWMFWGATQQHWSNWRAGNYDWEMLWCDSNEEPRIRFNMEPYFYFFFMSKVEIMCCCVCLITCC